jgi:hypothetical protein
VISPRNVDHGNTRKIKINQRKGSKNKLVTKAKVRVDIILIYPILKLTFL